MMNGAWRATTALPEERSLRALAGWVGINGFPSEPRTGTSAVPVGGVLRPCSDRPEDESAVTPRYQVKHQGSPLDHVAHQVPAHGQCRWSVSSLPQGCLLPPIQEG